eukprot:9494115-Pyramimonas_sp.AAC.1
MVGMMDEDMMTTAMIATANHAMNIFMMVTRSRVARREMEVSLGVQEVPFLCTQHRGIVAFGWLQVYIPKAAQHCPIMGPPRACHAPRRPRRPPKATKHSP